MLLIRELEDKELTYINPWIVWMRVRRPACLCIKRHPYCVHNDAS